MIEKKPQSSAPLTQEARQREVLQWLSRKLLWLSDNQHKLRRIQIQAMARQLGKVARVESGAASTVAVSACETTASATNARKIDGPEH